MCGNPGWKSNMLIVLQEAPVPKMTNSLASISTVTAEGPVYRQTDAFDARVVKR